MQCCENLGKLWTFQILQDKEQSDCQIRIIGTHVTGNSTEQ